jgi:hypothetical protein
MDQVTAEQVRQYRLHVHHLDRWYAPQDLVAVVGACGMQNTPPGAWEAALSNRVAGWGAAEAVQALETDRRLLQAWSIRGAPLVFPTEQADVFLAGLIPAPGEPWVYTQGIGGALDALAMGFDELLGLVRQAMPQLDRHLLRSKTTLDQTVADWVRPHLPADKLPAWDAASMYGPPARPTPARPVPANPAPGQTLGAAVVSFLLRPCACLGLVVFGPRQATSPSFTSFARWVGHPLVVGPDPGPRLARRFVHCYAPATPAGLAHWLGCSPGQARRLWAQLADQLVPVTVSGTTRWVLADDRALLADPPAPKRRLHLLAGHDPYLGLPDRDLILDDPRARRQVWQTVSNPGAVVRQGCLIGTWTATARPAGLVVTVRGWQLGDTPRAQMTEQAERYAASRGRALAQINLAEG